MFGLILLCKDVKQKVVTLAFQSPPLKAQTVRTPCESRRCSANPHIPFEVNADPFYLQANQAHIDRAIKQLETKHGKVHRLSDAKA